MNIDTAELRRMMAEATPGPWVRAGLFDNPHDAALSTAAVNALPALLDEVERLRGGCEDCDIARRDFAHSQDLDYVKWAAERERLTAENAALLARAEAAEAKVTQVLDELRPIIGCVAFEDRGKVFLEQPVYAREEYDRLRALAGKEGE